jgi:predicted metal-binding transcription factor (methanogenesis marker protein 9)
MTEKTPLEMLKQYKAKKEDEANDIQAKIDIIEKYAGRKPLYTKEETIEILGLVCYGNLGYCCGLQKDCIWRNTVLNIFVISPDEYVDAKIHCQKELIGSKIE